MSLGTESNANIYVPDIYWAQTSKTVSLKIILSEVKVNSIEIKDNTVFFDSFSNNKNYKFELKLSDEIEDFKYSVSGRTILINLTKKDSQWWNSLQTNNILKPFIKVDWDKWVDEDEDKGELLNGMDNMMGMPPGLDLSSLGDMSGNLPGMEEMMKQSQGINQQYDDDEEEDEEEEEEEEEEEDDEENELSKQDFDQKIDSITLDDRKEDSDKQMNNPDYEMIDKDIILGEAENEINNNHTTEVNLDIQDTVNVTHPSSE